MERFMIKFVDLESDKQINSTFEYKLDISSLTCLTRLIKIKTVYMINPNLTKERR